MIKNLEAKGKYDCFKVGHGAESQTRKINVALTEAINIADTQGLHDTSGNRYDIVNSVTL